MVDAPGVSHPGPRRYMQLCLCWSLGKVDARQRGCVDMLSPQQSPAEQTSSGILQNAEIPNDTQGAEQSGLQAINSNRSIPWLREF
jgi:hypothetical protein